MIFRPYFLAVLWLFTLDLQPHRAMAAQMQMTVETMLPSPLEQPALARIQRERDYLLQNRAYLEQRLRQIQPLRQLVNLHIRQHRLPEALGLLPLLESGYRLDVVSSQGATGLWQLMPDTARRFGLRVAPQWDERLCLPQATQAALAYLGWLHRYFAGDWLLALAAYNAGEGRVRRAQRELAKPDYWRLALPEETRRYVPRLLALVEIIQHAERYALRLPDRHAPAALTTAAFTGPTSLAELAAAGPWPIEQLRALNPALRRSGLPGDKPYPLVVPSKQAGDWPGEAQRLGVDMTASTALVPLDSLADPLISHSARGLDMQRRPAGAVGQRDPLGLGRTLRIWQQE